MNAAIKQENINLSPENWLNEDLHMFQLAFSSPDLSPHLKSVPINLIDYDKGNLLDQLLSAQKDWPKSDRGIADINSAVSELQLGSSTRNDIDTKAKMLPAPFNERLLVRWKQHIDLIENYKAYRRSAAFGTRGTKQDVDFYAHEEPSIENSLRRHINDLRLGQEKAKDVTRRLDNYEIKAQFKIYSDTIHELIGVEISAMQKCLDLVRLLLLAWSRPSRDGKFVHVHALKLSLLVDDILTNEDIATAFNDGRGSEISFDEALKQSFEEYKNVGAELAK